jgi:hypothetical protein
MVEKKRGVLKEYGFAMPQIKVEGLHWRHLGVVFYIVTTRHKLDFVR